LLKCQSCGTDNDDDSLFCEACGKPFPPPIEKSAVKLCKNCGKEIKQDDTFCSNCGYAVSWTKQSSTTGSAINVGAAALGGAAAAGYAPYPQYAQPVPYVYPPVDLKDPGIAMIIGILMPGFGHVYCGKVLQGLLIFFTFVAIILFSFTIGILMLGIGTILGLLLLFFLELLQLLSVRKKAEKYNMAVRQTGRPPW
jgi:hypothetical protein